MVLEYVSSPKDLKNLSIKDLETLCSELRSEIVRIVNKNGGHLGSNLGAVELIVASHFVFDCPTDKFIFDVGHQAYAHKLLTGRKNLMENLRKESGASGFPLPSESEYDSFISGHASTSLSAALGIACSRDLDKKNFNVISFIGDGSIAGGMIYEAFNNMSEIMNFIVVLNDNQMSISKSVGAMNKYLSKLLASQRFLSLRRHVGRFLDFLPRKISVFLEKLIKNILGAIKGGTIFEEFGFQYIGPIDGHNLIELISVFSSIKKVGYYKPVLIHSVTKKGKGYAPAESDFMKLHGVETKKEKRFTDVFAQKICDLGKKNEKIVCITPAMKSGSGLVQFSELFPGRFFDVGICEEHAVTFSAGLSSQGYKPFLCLYSTFLRRGFDQIYHDVFLQNLNVTFIVDKAGVPAGDGQTHSGLYDSAIFSMFQNFPILAPVDGDDFADMLEFANSYSSGPISIRFPKSCAEKIIDNSNELALGHGRIIRFGKTDLIVSFGAILRNILIAIEKIKEEFPDYNPTIMDARFVQPFDFDLFFSQEQIHERVFFIDESIKNTISAGILFDLFQKKSIAKKIIIIVAQNENIKPNSRENQLHKLGLSSEKIAQTIIKDM